MQHEAVWILPPQGESEGPTFITRTAPITQRPITYLLIGLLSLFGTHARAKSALRGLTCGYGGQRPRSGLLSHRCALYLHGEHSAHVQVSATQRSVCRSDGPELAADRRLSTPVSEQVSRLSDDFARALAPTLAARTQIRLGARAPHPSAPAITGASPDVSRSPASDDELTTTDQPPTRSTSCLLAHAKTSLNSYGWACAMCL